MQMGPLQAEVCLVQLRHNYIGAQLCITFFLLSSVKIHFASSGVSNKEVIAKEGKVKEVVYAGEGNGCEWNSNSILSSISERTRLHFICFCSENVRKDLLCRKVIHTNRNDCYHFIKSFILKA